MNMDNDLNLIYSLLLSLQGSIQKGDYTLSYKSNNKK